MQVKESPPIRKLGAALFVVALLLTLLGAFHVIENWRGKRKWEAYKRKLVAQGEKLDLHAFVPEPIPRDQNFAATPFFADLFPRPNTNWNSRHWPETFLRLNPQAPQGKRSERQMTDFVAWQRAIQGSNVTSTAADPRKAAAEEVLTVLKAYEPALSELRAAAARPFARFDVDYKMDNPWGILLPHLPVIKQVAQVASLKASAELAAGNAGRAMEDVRLLARLVNSMDGEIFLINYLVEIAAFQLMMQPIWEGLALGAWSDPQLEELQALLLRFNFIKNLERPLEAERAAGVLTVDILMKQRYKFEFLDALSGQQSGNVGIRNALALLVPKGWFRMEQYEYTRLANQFVLPGADGANRVIDPRLVESNGAQLERAIVPGWRGVLKHRMIAGLLLPAVVKVHRRAAAAQTAAHQAALACALERYRRKNNHYPADLSVLAPEFISAVPHDVIGKKPMKYKPGMSYVLYSVGWDDTDNGGTPGKVLWDEKGDWVWRYPQAL